MHLAQTHQESKCSPQCHQRQEGSHTHLPAPGHACRETPGTAWGMCSLAIMLEGSPRPQKGFRGEDKGNGVPRNQRPSPSFHQPPSG